MQKDKEHKVIIPEEHYQVLEFKQENLPGIAVVNKNLADFQPKEVFAWHCSIILECENLIDNEMPSKEEVEILDKFEDFLDEKIKGVDKKRPNALFLARITWNASRELIWRVFDPEITNHFLTDLIEREDYLREFEYRLDPDDEWKLAEWHLKKSRNDRKN